MANIVITHCNISGLSSDINRAINLIFSGTQDLGDSDRRVDFSAILPSDEWGVNSNPYDVSELNWLRESEIDPSEVYFSFTTPWDFPEPIFKALAKMFPAIEIYCSCYDEYWEFAGEGAFKGEVSNFVTGEEGSEVYASVFEEYGDNEEDEYDEEEED